MARDDTLGTSVNSHCCTADDFSAFLLTWADASLFQTVAWTPLESGVHFHVLNYCGLTVILDCSVEQKPWSCHTGPLFHSQCLLMSLALRYLDPGRIVHSLLFCIIRWLKFSQIWARDKSSVISTTNSPSVPRSISFPMLEMIWKVFHIPNQKRWWKPV